jgi:hypothetical protein
MSAGVRTEGNYHLQVSMPVVGDDLTLGSEVIPCSLTVTVTPKDKPPTMGDVTSLALGSEYGYGRIQYYESPNTWHLKPGEYEVLVQSRGNCSAAISRGAAVTFNEEVTHLTERYLGGVLRYNGGIFLLCGGLVGLIYCEVRQGA